MTQLLKKALLLGGMLLVLSGCVTTIRHPGGHYYSQTRYVVATPAYEPYVVYNRSYYSHYPYSYYRNYDNYQIWVKGHWDGDGYWVPGHWRNY